MQTIVVQPLLVILLGLALSVKAGQVTVNQCDDDMKQRLTLLETKVNHVLTTLKGKEKEKAARCPALFKPFNGHCYYIGTVPVSWNKAKAICQQLGAKLASVESYPEDQFLVTMLRKITAPGVNGYFTGGNDLAKHGRWIWDATGQPMTGYAPWVSGQGVFQKSNSGENVHIYWGPDKFKWHDHAPNAKDCGFICEK